MHAKKILVPVDFSLHSEQALKVAASMARGSAGTLLVIHVEEAPAAYGMVEFYYGSPDDADEQWLERALQEQLRGLISDDLGVTCQTRLLSGSPAEEIVRVATEEQVDLVVMTTHGHTGLRHLLMGSVAEHVVRGAPCPVLTLRVKDDGKA
jgi:nucleotide-binding universal stress UspA family protein